MPKPNEPVFEPADVNPQPIEDGDTPDMDVSPEPEPDNKPEPEPEDKPEPEPEEDGFKQYLKDNELPDSFESPEDLAKAYKEVLRQFKTEQTDRGREHPTEVRKEQPSDKKSYFNTKAADAHIKTMEDAGMFGDNQELAASYKSIAKVIDTAYGAELSKAEEVMTTMFSELTTLRDRVLGMEWNGLNPEVRKRVKRSDIDALMREHRLGDYESAVKFYAMTKDPSVFKLFAQKQDGGKEQPKPKQRFRWGARGGGDRSGQSDDYQDYILPNGEVDEGKLNRLPYAQADKISKAIIARESRRR